MTFALTGAWAFNAPDIVIDSNLNYNWSGVLVKKVRQLLESYGIDDPFEGKFQGPFLINESTVGEYLPESSRALITDIGNLTGLDLLRGQGRAVVEGISYELKDFKTELKARQLTADGLILASEVSAGALELRAESIILSLSVPATTATNS